jgi:hypothetical protein
MNRSGIIFLAYLFIMVMSLLSAEPYALQVNHCEKTGNLWFDSLNVKFVGNWPFGPSWAVAYDSARSIVFCGSGGGVYVLDVSDPTQPQELSDRIHTRGGIRGLFYEDSSQILYIAAGHAGLDLWDVTVPDNPAYLGSCVTRNASGVFTDGSYSYIADVDSGLRVINISDPTDPFEVGSCSTPGYAVDVYASDTLAYIADVDGGLRVINVSNPANPYEVGSYCDSIAWFENLDISGSYVYVADISRGLLILDISNPSNPILEGSCYVEEIMDVCVSDTYAYVTCCWYLCVVDISNPSNPVQIGSLWIEGDNPGITVSDTIAFVADGFIGLRVIDVSNPPYPYPEATYELPSGAYNVFVLGSYAFLSGSPGLRIIDISELTLPREVAHWDSCYICDVHVIGNYGYAAAGIEGFFVMDLWNPEFPIKVGSCPTTNSRGVFAIFPYVFVADESSGLRIADVSDPINPYYIGHYDTPGNAQDVYVLDTIAYVADGIQGLRIIDVSDVFNPDEIGFLDTRGTACGVFVSGTYAYVADSDSGFCIIDVSDPSNPQEVYHYTPVYREYITSLYGTGNYVVFGIVNIFEFFGFRFRIYDVSQPDDPQLVGYFSTPGQPKGIFADEPYIFVADGGCGLQIYENLLLSIEEKQQNQSSYPYLRILQNPIRGNHIELELQLVDKKSAELFLYNLLGQRVKSFSLTGLSIGKNKVRLQTKNLSSGVYFLRLEGKEINESIKVTFLK